MNKGMTKFKQTLQTRAWQESDRFKAISLLVRFRPIPQLVGVHLSFLHTKIHIFTPRSTSYFIHMCTCTVLVCIYSITQYFYIRANH